jgi:hypothetical protein
VKTITGARPTLPEQITDPEAASGAARLQDSLRTNLPENQRRIELREMENNAARVNTLRDLAGEGGGYTNAVKTREDATGKLYNQALARSVPVADNPQWAALIKLPAIRGVLKDAQINLQNQGLDLANPANTMRALDNAKKLLDTKIRDAQGAGGKAASHGELAGLQAAKTQLLDFMETVAPEYGVARTTFADLSRPINQMDVAGEVLTRGTAGTTDLAGNPRILPSPMLNSVRDEAGLIRKATGRQPAKTLEELLEPDQLARLKAVLEETDRSAAVARTGPNSATAQRLSSQRVLDQLGPVLGLSNLPQSTVGQTLLKPLQFMYRNVADPKIQSILTDALLNPGKSKELFAGMSGGNRSLLVKALNKAIENRVTRQALPALYFATDEN